MEQKHIAFGSRARSWYNFMDARESFHREGALHSADDRNTGASNSLVNSKLLTRHPFKVLVYNLKNHLRVGRMPFENTPGNLTFEPAALEAMDRAVEAACVVLRLSKREESLRQIVARKVIECAVAGERDPEVLCKMAVAELQREALEEFDESDNAGVVQ